MFLDSIALVETLPCLAEPGKIIVIGAPSRSLVEALPYLATLPNVITFDPEKHTLTLRRQPGFITLYADKVYITQVDGVDEGLQLLAALVEAINATWAHRDALVAQTVPRQVPRLLDVWSLLPRTNCQECGEATCMAFASALVRHERTLEGCTPLADDPAQADRRAALEAML